MTAIDDWKLIYTRTKSCAAGGSAADFQHLLKEVQEGEQK